MYCPAGLDFIAQPNSRYRAAKPSMRDAIDGSPTYFSSHNKQTPLAPGNVFFSVALTDVLIFEIEGLLEVSREILQSRC